jgi:hypothetical protein
MYGFNLPMPRALSDSLDLGRPGSRSKLSKPAIAALAERFVAEPPLERNARSESTSSQADAAPAVANNPATKWLISALVGVALIPTAILFVLLWQRMMQPHEAAPPSTAVSSNTASAPISPVPTQVSAPLEVALTSPDKIDAQAGEEVDFAVAIDATDALPSRSVLVVSALPEGAAFSEGRPYGVTGWSSA